MSTTTEHKHGSTRLRNKIAREIEITIEVQQAWASVKGNAMASGDDAYDAEVEAGINERLDNGDVWAWAAVTVKGEWRGIVAKDHLGCCSYADENDFRTNSGYFDDMREIVIDSILANASQIRRA